jgi:hypothetical protein
VKAQRDGVAAVYNEAALAQQRRQREAVSVLVDLRSAPEEFQTAEVAALAGPQVARVFHEGMPLQEALHVEALGGGMFEVAVEVGTRFRDVTIGKNPWQK